jgi:hypothetical protein
VSWRDWLGYDKGWAAQDRTPKAVLPFEEAREFSGEVGLPGICKE